MEFRQFVPEDWPKFSKIEKEIFEGDEITEKEFNRILKNKGFVGLFNGYKYVGYLHMRTYNVNGSLHRIGVNPVYQGKGYGNKLMEYAIDWFEQRECESIGLYVETKNNPAIGLYRKHGFEIDFEAWHYIIKRKEFVPQQITDDLNLKKLGLDQLDLICSTFPVLECEKIEKWMNEQKESLSRNLMFLGLFKNNGLQVFSRFSPPYSGCMPFVYRDISLVDPFIQLMFENFVLEDKDYLRITFDRYKKLANLFEKRGYQQHHHLYRMERKSQQPQ